MQYLYDKQRHLICVPYSIDALHAMAGALGIKKCWFHNNKHPHYDVPKRLMPTIGAYAKEVSPKVICAIINEALK